MRLGVGIPSKTTDDRTVPGDALRRFTRRIEAYGFSSAWALEHLIEPPSYKSSFADPLTTIATASGLTNEINLGTSILILPMRNPVLVAKRAATIQHYSGGEVALGLGAGYVEGEYGAVNVPFKERFARLTEGVEVLYRVLNEEDVTFNGEFYQLEDFTLEPNLDRPPRVLVGGGGRMVDGEWEVHQAIKERMLFADGWIASSGSTIAEDWGELAEFLEGHGRDPDRYDKVALQHLHFEPGADAEAVKRKQYKTFSQFIGDERGWDYVENNLLHGTKDNVLQQLARYEREGFDELIMHPASSEPQELSRQLALWRDHLLTEYT